MVAFDLVIELSAVFWTIWRRFIRSLGRHASNVLPQSSLERIKDVTRVLVTFLFK